ncbi:efflux RND transporter periplasmic adaptor subunit [Phenylobacterium sp.]|uniref:efflux RND transporter periplasmic adaptor subunit n=1 Tax=Phenylobacterium sp. TaxID=1871053 RepID=UPI0025F7E326|nr:efflux RND transporter periplasmic adaptor subunit [Phenylobacterium sp.]
MATPLARQIIDWDEFVGRFEPIQQVEVRPRISGYVQTVAFRDGEIVRKGQLLFVIDPGPYQAALSQARAEQKSAEAQAANAQVELQRSKTLLDQGFVSKSAYDAKLAQQRIADAAVAGAKAAVEARALDVSYTRITSPIAGRVSDHRVDVGNLVSVAAAPPTLLTTVVSLDPIHFAFTGSEQVYLKYQRANQQGTRTSSRYASNPVDIQLQDETGYNWHGRMDFVDNALDEGSGTIRGRAVVRNPDNLLTPGMYGRMRLLGSGAYTALLIPDSSVSADQSEKIVMVAGPDDKATPHKVQLGPIVDGLRVVRAGLTASDRVIIEGQGRVRPGDKVAPKVGRIVAAAPTAPQPSVLSQPAAQATRADGAQ